MTTYLIVVDYLYVRVGVSKCLNFGQLKWIHHVIRPSQENMNLGRFDYNYELMSHVQELM